LVTLGHGKYTITGDARMNDRPMGELFKALKELGADVEARLNCLPATIRGRGVRGGKVTVSVLSTTQFVSALLLIASRAGLAVNVAEGDEPHGYIEMTRRMLSEFRPEYAIEPDLSSASYFVAVQFVTGGRVTVAGWPEDSLQIDGQFPKFLPPPAKVSRLRELGDGVLTLAICALFGQQPLEVVEAWQLREQECDRLQTMVRELKRIGARAEEKSDGFTVWPATDLHGADIETYNDHRMAMCFSVLGLKVPGIRIKNPSCVNKTFPNFFDKLEQLRR
jgi:3-phosphoshikimate 1-carboxyvinyltransferase